MTKTNKRIVIDANILIRAALGKKVRELIQNNAKKVLFFTLNTCYQDALKYLPILFEKRKLLPDDVLNFLAKLKCLIQIDDQSLIFRSFLIIDWVINPNLNLSRRGQFYSDLVLANQHSKVASHVQHCKPIAHQNIDIICGSSSTNWESQLIV